MPWSPSQHRLFEAAAHNPAIAKSHGMSPTKAAQMAAEGVADRTKKPARGKELAQAIRGQRK